MQAVLKDEEQTEMKRLRLLRSNLPLPMRVSVKSKKIFKEEGGSIWIGDPFCGISDLTISPGACPEDLCVRFSWKSHGLLIGHLLFSTQAVLKKPLRLRLSYKDALLNDIEENKIRIYRFDEKENRWKLLGGRVDRIRKHVVGKIDRSACVALGVECC